MVSVLSNECYCIVSAKSDFKSCLNGHAADVPLLGDEFGRAGYFIQAKSIEHYSLPFSFYNFLKIII